MYVVKYNIINFFFFFFEKITSFFDCNRRFFAIFFLQFFDCNRRFFAIFFLRFRDHALQKKKVPLRRYTEVSTDASLTEFGTCLRFFLGISINIFFFYKIWHVKKNFQGNFWDSFFFLSFFELGTSLSFFLEISINIFFFFTKFGTCQKRFF